MNTKAYSLFITAIALLVALPCAADLYRYTDEAGRVHIVASPEEIPLKYRDKTKVTKSKPFKGKGAYQKDVPRWKTKVEPEKPKPQVELFVTSWCGYCKKLEAFLKEEKIAYVKHDIEKNKQAKATHKALGGGGVPVSKVGDKVVRGFNPKGIQEAIAQLD